MTEGYEPGREARLAILTEVYRREATGESPHSIKALAESIGLSRRQVARYLDELEAAGVLVTRARMGRRGSEVLLTDCGRAVLVLLD